MPDDGRNIWVPIPTTPVVGGQGFLQAFWAVAESSRALTINIFGVSTGGTGNYYQSTPLTLALAGAQFVECTGNSTTGPYGAGQATGTGVTPTNNVSFANIGDIAFGFCIPASGSTVVEGAACTNIAGALTNRSGVYRVASAAGSTAVNFTQAPTGIWGVLSLIVGGPKATNAISGSLGTAGAGAQVTLTSQTSGYVQTATADGSGNYSATLESDTYTIQAQLVGVVFSPNLITGVANTSPVTGKNFTATAVQTAITYAQTITDTGNRANENPIANPPWAINGTPVPPFDSPFQIVSDEIVASNVTIEKNYAGPFSGDAVSVWASATAPMPSSQFCEFRVDSINPLPSNHATFALSFRSALSNVTGYFYSGVPNGDGTITLAIFALAAPVFPVQPTNLLASPGLFNQRITYWRATVPLASGDTFRAVAIWSTLYLFHNGTLIGTFGDFTTKSLFAGTLVLYAGVNAQGDVQLSNVRGGTAYLTYGPTADVVNAGVLTVGATSVRTPAFVTNLGDGLLCFVRWFRNASQNISTITDLAGNTFVIVGAAVPEGTTELACYYCAAATHASATNKVSCAFSASATFIDFTVIRVPGGLTLDNLTSSTTAAATSIAGSITTTGANELVFCYVNADSSSGTAPAATPPVAQMQIAGGTPLGGGFCNTGFQVVPTAATVSVTSTMSSSLTAAQLLVAMGYTPRTQPPPTRAKRGTRSK